MKTNLLKTQVVLAMAAALFCGVSSASAVSLPNGGTLNITILDENGALVPNAPVYIFGEAKTKFIGGKEIPGTATLDMPAGTYRVSSAIMRKTGEYYDRFASREAHVEVVAGDNTVVILHLSALEAPVAEQGQMEVSMFGEDVTAQLARRY